MKNAVATKYLVPHPMDMMQWISSLHSTMESGAGCAVIVGKPHMVTVQAALVSISSRLKMA